MMCFTRVLSIATVNSLKIKTSSVIVTKTLYVQCRKSSQKPFSLICKHFTLKIHSCGQKALLVWRHEDLWYSIYKVSRESQQNLKVLMERVSISDQCAFLISGAVEEGRKPNTGLSVMIYDNHDSKHQLYGLISWAYGREQWASYRIQLCSIQCGKCEGTLLS